MKALGPIAAAAFAALVGCGGMPNLGGGVAHCHNEWHFHASFPVELRPTVELAFAKWRAFSGRKAHLADEGVDADEIVCSVRTVSYGDDEYWRLRRRHGEDFLALQVDSDGSLVFVVDAWRSKVPTDQIALWMAMHEVAHSYGMRHTEGVSVMNIRGWVVTNYTDVDRAECEISHACVDPADPSADSNPKEEAAP